MKSTNILIGVVILVIVIVGCVIINGQMKQRADQKHKDDIQQFHQKFYNTVNGY